MQIYLNVLTFLRKSSIIILTEPDTPLNDADHVGSFNLYGSENYETKETSATNDGRRTDRKLEKSWTHN